jgi:UDPglucose--hexose-1-phosphate uridylyltransferase
VPYETVVGPAEPDDDALASPYLAPTLKLLAELVRRLQRLEGRVPLNAWIERHPNGWSLVLFPRLNVLAGLELGAGIYVNTLAPEEAADRLRTAEGG